MIYKGYYIDEVLQGFEVFENHSSYLSGEDPVYIAETLTDAKMWIDRVPLEEVRPFICSGCGQVLDEVVASFAVVSWDEPSGDYTKIKDLGDLACPHCMTVVSRVRFYPPEE